MAQKVSAQEILISRALHDAREGRIGLVQCAGCRDEVLVMPARPGHWDSCEYCASHCRCFRMPDGIY